MGLLLLIIPSVLSLSTDTSSWCFSPPCLPVFDNKIESAAIVPTVAQREHSAGCAVLVLPIKTKFPLQSPDDHFLNGSDQSWRGKVHANFCTSDEIKQCKSYNPARVARSVLLSFALVCKNEPQKHFSLVRELWLQCID